MVKMFNEYRRFNMERNKEYVFEGWNNKAVLLFHGATSGSSQLRPYANYLNCLGYTVYGMNLAGHGTTKENLASIQYQDIINKAENDYKVVKSKYEKVFVSGLSLGGLTTLYLASNHPEISGIIPLAAGIYIVENSFFGSDYNSEYIHRPTQGKVGLYKQYHIHYEYIPTNFFEEIDDMIKNFLENNLAEKITSPALIIHPLNDSTVYSKSANYIYDSISSVDKELVLPENGEHIFVLSEYRYDVFEKIANFLAKH
jgi:carboxylesterase